jgi:hypothetical protein
MTKKRIAPEVADYTTQPQKAYIAEVLGAYFLDIVLGSESGRC